MEYGLFRVKRVIFEVNAAEWIGTRAMGFSGEELGKMRIVDIISHMLGFEGLFLSSTILSSHSCILVIILYFRGGSWSVKVPTLRHSTAGLRGSVSGACGGDGWVLRIHASLSLPLQSAPI